MTRWRHATKDFLKKVSGCFLDSAGGARAHTIGDWTFFAVSHELVRGSECVRLEPRAASILEYLSEHRGEVVSREALIAHVWGARQVSANSLPTAIHAIRRALGDDAKHPRYLETFSKGGYRIVAAPIEPRSPPVTASQAASTRRLLLTAVGLAAVGVLGAAALILGGATWSPPPRTLLLSAVPNETGDPRYDVLARASESVLVAALTRRREFHVSRADQRAGRGEIRLYTKLVLWSGLPDLVVEAQDAQTSAVVWSGFASGPEDTLPARIERLVSELAASQHAHAA